MRLLQGLPAQVEPVQDPVGQPGPRRVQADVTGGQLGETPVEEPDGGHAVQGRPSLRQIPGEVLEHLPAADLNPMLRGERKKKKKVELIL